MLTDTIGFLQWTLTRSHVQLCSKKKLIRHHGSVKCVMVFDDSLVILRDVTIK